MGAKHDEDTPSKEKYLGFDKEICATEKIPCYFLDFFLLFPYNVQ